MSRILVIGETILDLAPVGGAYEPVLGGSAFNTARALGALGPMFPLQARFRATTGAQGFARR